MYLQLAEGYDGYPMSDGYLSSGGPPWSGLSDDRLANYVWMPDNEGGGEYWHIKNFDGMAPRKFDEMIEALAPYQPMSEGLSRGGRAKDWKDQKREAKAARDAAKTANIQGRADKKQAAVRYKDAKAQAAATGGDTSGGIKGLVGKGMETIGNIFGKGGGDTDAGGNPNRVDVSVGPPPPPPGPTFMEQYGTYVIIGGVIVLIGGAYLLTRK